MRYSRLILLSILLAAGLLIATPREPALAADPPVVSAVTPSTGVTSGGTLLTIYGSGFASGAYVAAGGVLSPAVTVVSSTQITAVSPAGVAGPAQIVVINPDGQSGFFTGFTYSTTTGNNGSLWVAGISPPSGAAGQLVTITGAGFEANATAFFGGVPASSVVWVSSGYLMTYAPAGSGTVSVMIVNPNGQSATAPTQFTHTGAGATSGALSITSVAPGNTAAGNALAISGAGFEAGATVTVGGYAATNVGVVTSTLITATAPAGPSGAVTVVVTNPGGAAASFVGLAYGAGTAAAAGQPSVAGVSPSSGSSAGGTTVSISGSGFVAPVSVTFGGVPATSVTVVNGNLITATTPANPVGPSSVVVSNPSGALGGLTAGFTYELAWPRVTSVSPSTGALGGGTTLSIQGSGFAPGATVTIGGQSASTVSAVSPTQIVVTTPAGPAGAATVLVTNPGGAISGLAGAFSYSANPQPQTSVISVAGVTPASGPAAGGTAVTIHGGGFLPGATVSIGGITVAATVLSPTQIAATAPAVTGTGSVTVTVANPGGTPVALPGAFTYTSSAGGASASTPAVPAGGGLFVFAGGTNAQLVTASGCNASTAVFWTTDSRGAWIGYIPSVPVAIVNAPWQTLFPNGIPAGTPIVARC